MEDAMTEQHSSLSERLAEVAGVEDAFLTTTGRASGEAHEVDLYFGVEGERIYLLAGGGAQSDWVKNAVATPRVAVRISGVTFRGTARVIAPGEEDAHARLLLAVKYERWHDGKPLSSWVRTSLPVAVDVVAAEDIAP
jgi:deazaflavin-dependent oxidoreductase (nitroreductase family)